MSLENHDNDSTPVFNGRSYYSNGSIKIFTQGTVAKLLAASGLCLALFGVNEIGTRSEMERRKKAELSKSVPTQVNRGSTPHEIQSTNTSVEKK